MSKSERQTISFLSIVSGCLNTIEDFNLDPKNLPIILYAKEECNKAIHKYPCNTIEQKTQKWIISKMKMYDTELKKRKNDTYDALILTSMCQQILEDILSKIKNKSKIEIISPLNEAIMALHDKIDPKGNKFDIYKKANELLNIAYHIFEFSIT